MAMIGIPPSPVTALLRLEGLAIGIVSIVGYDHTGASWWWYLAVLAPDLSFFGLALGQRRAAIIYDVVHTYVWAALLIVAGLLTPAVWLAAVGLIWATHIGFDRALGYGLRYPDSFETSHLGLMGGARKAAKSADPS